MIGAGGGGDALSRRLPKPRKPNMARSCACDRWLSRAAADLGFLALPPAAQLLFFRLLAAAAGAEDRGHLRFPDRVSASVSRLLNRPETDVETDLAALADLGWITLDDDGRGVWMAGAKAASARAEAAQINGLRGGRPRRGESKEAARERRQAEMLFGMQGGAAETQETKPEPKPESSRVAAMASSMEESSSKPRENPVWVSLGMELAEMAGLDPAKGGHNLLPVKGWIDAGADPDVVREVIRRCVARPSYKPVRSLQWFHQPVMEAVRKAAAPEPTEPSGYEAVLREWQRNGMQGSPPSLAEWRAAQAAA